jgi:Ca2+-binding EF-hand superfamily protein
VDSEEENDNDHNDNNNKDDDEEEEEEGPSLYEQTAESEFQHSSGHAITQYNRKDKPQIDWGGEYDNLRSRMKDLTQYSSKSPTEQEARALFRTMTMETPNEAIMNFVNSASSEVVSAMSAAVTNLLGGLSTPGIGVETIVKANGEKLTSLCFQLQMTGYMFRNAEYVLAIRDLMKLNGSQITIQDYKDAFERMDVDGSGFIETTEIEQLFENVYGEGETPAFEVDTFMDFFDANQDGKISWDEFERGLGLVADRQVSRRQQRNSRRREALPGMKVEDDQEEDDDDDDDSIEDLLGEPTVSGTIDIEMKNGKIIQVEAKEYIEELKREAEVLKAALSREKSGPGRNMANVRKSPKDDASQQQQQQQQQQQGISSYIDSLGGDIESLTKGISPVVVESMKMLVNFVIDGGPSGRNGKFKDMDRSQIEMEIPGSALQQLALWQLVLGYKLREAEATGEYRKMLE